MLHPTNDEIIYIVKNEFKKKKDGKLVHVWLSMKITFCYISTRGYICS